MKLMQSVVSMYTNALRFEVALCLERDVRVSKTGEGPCRAGVRQLASIVLFTNPADMSPSPSRSYCADTPSNALR